jgi:hypothetical protein
MEIARVQGYLIIMSHPWSEIRQGFYRLLAAGLSHDSASIGSPPRLCWSDLGGAFNHVWLYPFLSPTPSCPHLPWIARVAVNILDPMLVPNEVARSLCVTSWYPDWHLELTLLPEELADFAPWVAQLADAHDVLWSERVVGPPRRLHRPLTREGLLDAASLWSESALARYEEFCAREDDRQRRLHRLFEAQVALAELQALNGSPNRLLQTG